MKTSAPDRERVVGSKVARVDATEKVTGQAKYAPDIYFDRMVHCALVLARKPHGVLHKIDTSRAQKYPGVFGVFTYRDVPGKNRLGEVVDDMPCLVAEGETVKHYGDVVAVVAASTQKTAEEAARKVRLTIEELPAVLDIGEARKDEIRIHGSSNVSVHKKIRKGDVSKAFSKADLIIEDEFMASYQEHAYIEPQGVVLLPDTDYGMTVYGSIQCPYYVQASLSKVLGLPMSKVRIIQAETGGAFGGKEDVPSFVASYAAVAAYNLKRPARLIYPREIDIHATSKRHPVKSHYKMGFSRDGKILAIEVDAYMDMGAYATLSPIVMFRTLVHAAGAYSVDNVRVDTYGVYTNKVPPGAFRGFGSPQVLFAVESMVDEASKRLEIDPVDMRMKNALREGYRTCTDHLLTESVGAVETLDKVNELSNWKKLNERVEAFNKDALFQKRGVGLSHIIYGVSLGAQGHHIDKSGAHVQINRDGSVDVRIGGTEMGQGARTVMAIIAAEELGQRLSQIVVHQTDTAFVPDSGPTVASRTTMFSGNAVRVACKSLRERLVKLYAELNSCSEDEVELHDGMISCRDDKNMSFDELIEEAFKKNVKMFEAGWYQSPVLEWNPEIGIGQAYITYSFASQVVVVEVDTVTGNTKVLEAYTVHDVGKAINPEGVIGQIQGGFVQGMGYALSEDLKMLNGRILTDNFNTYIIPTIRDIPRVFKYGIVEDEFSEGPYGAKGIGEPSLMATPPAIANAISRAIGKRIRQIPATPEYVLKVIKEDT